MLFFCCFKINQFMLKSICFYDVFLICFFQSVTIFATMELVKMD